jgi:DNA-binding SARP family transcriptional activator
MHRLNLCLLGPGELSVGGRALRPHSTKALALLAFLAIESDRSHGRAALAELLWGPGSESAARHSLRQALHSLRTLDAGQLAACLRIEPDRVRFVPGAVVDVDVRRFVEAAEGAEPDRWREAAGLYRAPLLDGRAFDAPDAFANWLDAARMRLHALATHNLDRLAVDGLSRGDADAALAHALALRALEPGSEAACRHLMRLHAARGEAQAVEAEWARLGSVLQREFGTAPSRQSEALYRGLIDRPRGDSPAADAPPPKARDAEPFVRAARAAEAVHAYGNAVDLYERALSLLRLTGAAAAARVCEVLLLLERALERLGRRAEQSATLDEAIAIAGCLDDSGPLAAALLRQAGVLAYLGRHPAAVAAARRALEMHRAAQDRPGEAEALRELGFVHWHAEDFGAALDCSRRALALHRALGDVAGEASALHNLAEIDLGLGSPARALDGYEQALQLHWSCRAVEGEILSLYSSAHALEQVGDAAGSQRRLEAALQASERHGDRTMQSRTMHAISMQACRQGGLDAGLAWLQRAIAIDRAIGYAHALGHDLLDLSALHLMRGERIQARAALEEARVWFTCTDEHDAAAATLDRLARLDAGDAAITDAHRGRTRIRSHLPLAEGKVYCSFESPLAALRAA